jgi:hypothetical protein
MDLHGEEKRVKKSINSLAVLFLFAAAVYGQTPRALAPSDLTGYWVSVINEDWRWRMVVPPKGDFSGIHINDAGLKLLNAWDPAADVAAGNQCKSFGAASIMRMPTRLRISWENDRTLKVETDYGQQTRMFSFDASQQAGPRTWQGMSKADWIGLRPGQGQGAGALKVVTTNIRAQYLHRNGYPVSENAVITEMFERIKGPAGDEWLIVKTIVEDPAYLTAPHITSSNFKREADASKWNPVPCEVLRPLVDEPAHRRRETF